ncbi:MAG: FMN-dependent NADH-azoreductase [Syntrophobacteraceae bacterium]
MAKVLHIQASPMKEISFSNRLARAFLDAFQARNPAVVIETLDLWTADLPAFDITAASGKYKVMRGLPHSQEEGAAWARVIEMVEQLKSASKVVVSTGMWNFSLPYRLKQYLDIIVQPGLTFSFDPEKGYTGLVAGRPIQLLLASGGEYPVGSPGAAWDYQKPYLEMIFGFVGFSDIRTLRVEGTLGPNAAENLTALENAAKEAAAAF